MVVTRTLTILAFSTFFSTPANADPWELAGASVRDLSMAGAGAAGTVPGAAIPLDPASVAGVNGETIAVAWRGTYPKMKWGDLEVMEGPIHALDLAVAFGGPLGSVRAGGGFAMYLPLPNAVKSKVHMDADAQTAPMLEDAADFVSFDLASGLGWGPIEIAIGASVGINLVADTTVSVRSLSGDKTEKDGLDLTESVDVDLERRLEWTATPLVGLRLHQQPVDAFVSYRGQSGFETEGDTDIGFDFEGDSFDEFFTDVAMPVAYMSVWTPARVAMGVSVQAGRFRPGLVAKYMWANGWRDTQNRVPDPVFLDVPSVALGLEADLIFGVMARTGYGLQVSPVPNQTGLTRFADTDRHVIGLGLAWARGGIPRENDKTELAIGVQGQRLSPRDIAGSELNGWIWTMSTGLVTRL